MRKLALLCLLLPLPLSAAVFSSNSIGQEISPKEMLDGSGYELERDGGVSTLYLDGNPVMVRTESDEGYTVESEGYEESVVISDGRRERSTIREGGRETSYTYFYDGDRLSSVSISVDGELAKRIVYLDTASGTPAAFSGDISGYILPSCYIYDRIIRMELPVGIFEGLPYTLDRLNEVKAGKHVLIQSRGIAYESQYGLIGTLAEMGLHSHSLEPGYKIVDLCL